MDRCYFDGNFQPTIQPTEYDVLYDFRVLFDTVEVCGSSPHGPTISFNNLEAMFPFRVAPYCSNKSLCRCIC